MKNWLRSLNTHLAALAGVLIGVAGFVVQPQVSGVVIPMLPAHAQADAGAALNIIGLALAYFGRPKIIPSDPVLPASGPIVPHG